MSIKFKMLLLADALVLAAVLMFGSVIYTSERAMLLRQSREMRDGVLESLSKVTAESIASEDEATLMAYTADLKRMTDWLAEAYVADSHGMVLAHTDKEQAPKQLPLSYSGQRVRTFSDKLLVRSKLEAARAKGVSFSSREITVNGKRYTVAVGCADARIAARVDAALHATLRRIAKASALVFAAATLLSLWIASWVTRPVRKLARAFAATGSGDLRHKLADTGRTDELGALTREYNSMVDKLRELDEMKKDFVSSVTHELKSPLGAIESYLDLMSYEVSQGRRDPAAWESRLPKFLENIAFVKQNSQRLLRFITDLLDAARIEKGKFEISRRHADVEPLIAEAVKLFSGRAAEAGINLKAELPAKLPRAYIDPERITQVLVNLVSNALKYTPHGGNVTVSASVRQPSGGVGGALRVTVADTGHGIAPEAQARLFGKFYQAPGARRTIIGPKGTGLGLYIVKTIVEAHGGKVSVESSAAGSKFSFELPLRRGDMA